MAQQDKRRSSLDESLNYTDYSFPENFDGKNHVLDRGGSKKFLIAVLIYCVSVLVGIVNAFVFAIESTESIRSMVMSVLPSLSYNIANDNEIMVFGYVIALNIQGVLIGVCLLSFYFSCKKGNKETRALNVVKALLFVAIGAIGLLAVMLIIAFFATFSFLFILAIGVLALLASYYLNVTKTISLIHSTLKNNVPRRFPTLVITMNYIFAIANGAILLLNFTIVGLFSVGLMVAFMVIISMEMQKYNDRCHC